MVRGFKKENNEREKCTHPLTQREREREKESREGFPIPHCDGLSISQFGHIVDFV